MFNNVIDYEYRGENSGITASSADLFRLQCRMVSASERYYNILRIMLIILGLWPYKPSVLQKAFYFSAYISFIFFQFTMLLSVKCNIGNIIQVFSYILIVCMYFLMYNCFYFNAKKIKYLLEQIETDWNTFEDREVRILEKYAMGSRMIALILIYLAVIGIILLVIVEMLPIIFDAVSPINISRLHKTTVNFDMFLDQQQYFYVYLMFEIMMAAVGFLTTIAISSSLIVFLRHSCSIYKIASTLIGNTVTKHTLEIPDDRKAREMYQRIFRAVCMHRKAVQFTKSVLDVLNKWLFVLIGICVLSLSCNIFQLLMAMTVSKELSIIVMCIGLVFAHVLIMFLGNFLGQMIIDHSAEIFIAAYSTAWYLAPLLIQKLLLFVIQHSMKPSTIMIGRICTTSLEGFSTLTTMSVSYFSVLYNIN